MNKIVKFSVIGLGARGMIYLNQMLNENSTFKLASVCDNNPERIELFKKEYDSKNVDIFLDENHFFAKNVRIYG